MPRRRPGRRRRRSRNRSGRWAGGRESRSQATAQWLSVTRAKAQKAQKTKACARPGSGRSRMTLAWQSTSQNEIPDALADGEEVEARVLFRFEDFVEDEPPKRRQKSSF
jgi:hypothetical protein